MEYPHARYVKYLISKRMDRFEIASECANYQLIPPNDADLTDMYHSVGFFPNSWKKDIKNADPEFRDWLDDLEVLEMWEQDSEMSEAFGFLNQGKLRESFESLMLLHADVEVARQALQDSFPTRRVPSQSVLELYCYCFWDVLSMSKPGLFSFLKAQQNTEFKLAALDGEADYTYAVLGLRKKPDILENLDLFLQLAKLETIQLLRNGGIGSGQRAAGQAALMKATLDVMSMRMEMTQDEAGSDLKKDAAIFQARIVKRRSGGIPSIDDLRGHGDVIDAEYTPEPKAEIQEAGTNVRRLPARRGPAGG